MIQSKCSHRLGQLHEITYLYRMYVTFIHKKIFYYYFDFTPKEYDSKDTTIDLLLSTQAPKDNS